MSNDFARGHHALDAYNNHHHRNATRDSGWLCLPHPVATAVAKSISEYISLMTDIFLRLIKMIIAPWYSLRLLLVWRTWAIRRLLVALVPRPWPGLFLRHWSPFCWDS